MSFLFKNNNMLVWLKNFTLDIDLSKPTDGNVEFTLGSLVDGEWGYITAATGASPIVVTSVAHGLSNSEDILIVDCAGNLVANGEHITANVTTDTFELSGTTGTAALTLPTNSTDYPRWFKVVDSLKNMPMDYVSNRGYAGDGIVDSIDLVPEAEYWVVVRVPNYGYEAQGLQRCKVRKLGAVI